MRALFYSVFFLAATLIGKIADAQSLSPDQWYSQGRKTIESAGAIHPITQQAKNVILFVGDGMGVSTVTAARILDGQLRGMLGEENILSFETLPYTALSKTYNTNQQTPDSAGTMTAMMTGIKTKAGVISVNQYVMRANCASSKNNHIETLLEEAESAGRSTGIVTTARLTHATPAAAYAHSPERGWEDDHDLTAEAKRNGCKDIATQLVEFPLGNGIEVAMGGGRRGFWPDDEADPEYSDEKGQREDGRNLTEAWLARNKDAAFVWNTAQFDSIDPKKTQHLLGLFDDSHMAYEADRKKGPDGEPSLSEMTRKAIEILKNNPKGFFLMVESGRIDHAHHAGNAYRALTDTIEFANAVNVGLEQTVPNDTLIVVTADHSHVLTISGYPTRGNPILGKVIENDEHGNPESGPALADDNKPYTTLGYQNGPGFAVLPDGDAGNNRRLAISGRVEDLSKINTEAPGFHQESLVPGRSETHGGEDVAVYARGAGAYRLRGVIEQNVIYHLMRKATGLPRIGQKE